MVKPALPSGGGYLVRLATGLFRRTATRHSPTPRSWAPPVGTPGTHPPHLPPSRVLEQPMARTYVHQWFEWARMRTPSGEAFLPKLDQATNPARHIPRDPNRFTVAVHGWPDRVAIGYAEFSPRDLAQFLRSRSSAWNGEDLRLVSCHTGSESSGFAQRLADELGVKVSAPDTRAWNDVEGNVWAASNSGRFFQDGLPIPTDPPDGKFIDFSPRPVAPEPSVPPWPGSSIPSPAMPSPAMPSPAMPGPPMPPPPW